MDASLCRFESCSGHFSFQLMEVGLFSKCIKETIGDLRQVAVPHLGVFSTETVGASYSDRQTTINPPYLRVSFHKRDVDDSEGKVFLSKIAEEVGTDIDQAEVELNWCISRICSELEGNKICALPGLGLMKANSKNEFFFISSEETELYPEGLELEPICIKRRVEEVHRPEVEVEAEVSVEAVELPQAEQTPETPQPTNPYLEKQKKQRKRRGSLTALIVVVAVFAVALAAITVLNYFNADMSSMLDKILYSKEELELLGR